MNELYSWFKPEFVASFFLIIARVSGVFLVAPLLSNRAVPIPVRAGIILMISLILFPILSTNVGSLPFNSNAALIALFFQEITIGLILGFIASLVFATIQMAGEIMGMQVGFSIATIFDPANEGASSILTTLYVITGALLFLQMNGHHVIIAGLVRSFGIVPLGDHLRLLSAPALVEILSKAFSVAIQICIPLLVVTTVLNVIFGFMNKLSPQMGIYFNAAFIITPVVSILVLIASVPLFRVLFAQITDGLEPNMIRVLQEMKGR